jgi:serine protease Do
MRGLAVAAVLAGTLAVSPLHAQTVAVGWPGPGPRLGMTTRDLGSAEAARDKIDAGAIVQDVRPDTPADHGGFKKGDVVVQFDGERVRSARQLSRLVEETVAGRSVKATVVRDGRRIDLTVTPTVPARADAWLDGDRLRDDVESLTEHLPRNFDFEFDAHGSSRRLGVSVLELTPQLATYFGAPGGVLVSRVDDGSPAARAGIKPGDVIANVNNEPVKSRQDLLRALRGSTDEDVTIGVVREKKEMALKAKLEPRTRPVRRT